MDNKTTISEVKKMVQEFCEVRDWDQFHSPKELAISIATEAGELLQCFRFKSDEESRKIWKGKKGEHVNEEIADVFYFTLRLAQLYNIDLVEILQDKLKKNDDKYPVEKCKGCNKKYDEFE